MIQYLTFQQLLVALKRKSLVSLSIFDEEEGHLIAAPSAGANERIDNISHSLCNPESQKIASHGQRELIVYK